MPETSRQSRQEPRHAEDFSGTRPKIDIRDTDRCLRHVPGTLAEMRERFGPEPRSLDDVHRPSTPREAAGFAGAVEPVRLF